ncbi:hypothetical protein [Salibacter halophilus]|uniref:Lipoprotein n=1 Tax=Salibacter halophilus TaxID=1803916 RepID=A0A6N6M3T1_9FLAO|nr:hypothetical protein [Salibacter halophilus]KAB1062047.1 hypothetical protein F3059_13300 [Salibacter halophilus]
MNLKTFFSLLSLVLLLASCALLMPEEKRKCYRKLKDFADEHWKLLNHDSLLIESKGTLSAFIEKDVEIKRCAYKMNTSEIKKIFGLPHQIDTVNNKTVFYYFSSESCYPSLEKSRFCKFYSFHFNEREYCEKINVATLSTDS